MTIVVNSTMQPILAICNFFSDPNDLKAFALEHGFGGVDWSFQLEAIPSTPAEESLWVKDISLLSPLEVRYHCPFYQLDLGHDVPQETKKAALVFQRILRLVSKVKGKFLTIHIGLGHDSTEPLSWEGTIDNLRSLVHYGAQRGVQVCLENLAWGWTSKPQLFEKLIRGSGVAVTFDIGHARCCESVRSHYYSAEDFVTPHADRVFNAHVYHEEIPGMGHLPPERLENMAARLGILRDIGCPWWTLEVRDEKGVLQTKRIVDDYLTREDDLDKSHVQGFLPRLASRK
jgi:sugar phosphate isomerase/epimerase